MKTILPFEASERLIRLRQVIEMTGRSRTAIYDDISRGKFPRPVNRPSRFSLEAVRHPELDGRLAAGLRHPVEITEPDPLTRTGSVRTSMSRITFFDS